MKPINHFLIEPIGARYNNVKKVGEKELIVNSENQNHQYINRLAKVISCPFDNKTSITEGDTVLVHHNVFRRWSDVKGRDKNSSAYFKENLYLVYEDQILILKKNILIKVSLCILTAFLTKMILLVTHLFLNMSL